MPAIVTGEAGLIVVDADRHHPEADGIAALDALVDGQEWPPHPETITAGRGQHHFFLQPRHGPELGNATGKLPNDRIQVRGAGGIVIAPGAVRPDGAEYASAPGCPRLIEAYRMGAIPHIPEWLVRLIKPTRIASTDAVRPIAEFADHMTTYASAALRYSVTELSEAPAGNRNNRLNRAAYHLAGMAARRWISLEEIKAGLIEACWANGLIRDDGIKAMHATLRGALAAGLRKGHPGPRK